MRRYRFGKIAAFVAAGYVVAVTGFCIVALATGTIGPVWWLVVREDPFDPFPVSWWIVLLLGLVAAVQGRAYWQVVRGRVRGAPRPADRRVILLRWTLYLSVAHSVVSQLLPWWVWWLGFVGGLLLLVTVVLYFLVLRVTRWLRLAVLAGGLLSALSAIILTAVFGFGSPDMLSGAMGLSASPAWLSVIMSLSDVMWPAWMVPLLVAQTRDPRWSGTTVWMGALSLTIDTLQPSAVGASWVSDEVPIELVVFPLLGALHVFGQVWQARSAHELASPLPAAPPRPARAPYRWWPLPAVAIAFPLLPAAGNLAWGMPFWLGPRGEIERFIREDGSESMTVAWLALDLLVGVGAPAILILIAVLRRTRRLLRVTMTALTLTATIGVVSVLTTAPSEWSLPGIELRLRMYPDDLFLKNGEIVLTGGISPLWYCAALLASALTLLLLYASAPAERLRHHVLVAGLASAVALAFLPAADQARGPVTTAKDCEPHMNDETGEYEEPQLTAEQRFVCGFRQHSRLKLATTTPDQVLLAHGRRLCGVYTRNDPEELAREDLQGEGAAYPLAEICPSAAATVQAQKAARDGSSRSGRRTRSACATPPRPTAR